MSRKFGNQKWRQTQFANLEAAVCKETNKIISISGCKIYSKNMLRVAMHLYTLKNYRKTCRHIQFSETGFFYRHLQFAKSLPQIESLFLTVYDHNSKLKSHVKNLASRRFAPGHGKMHYIHDLIPISQPLLFHAVPQYFFLYPLKEGFIWDGTAPVPQ
jgi:hypothetical protein